MYRLSLPHATRLHWMATALSAAILVVALLFMIGEGVPRVSALSGTELALFGTFGLMLVGLAVGVFAELPGALLTLAGFAAFWGVHAAATGGARLGGAFALFPIAAALQLAAWWHGRRARAPRS